MLRIAEDCLPYEVRETAGFFVGDGAGIAHQHQPVGRERLAERRVDVPVGVGDEPQPFVEVQAADRNVVYGRVDLEKAESAAEPMFCPRRAGETARCST